MKKTFIFAAAALLALCACNKLAEVEMTPDGEIIPEGFKLVTIPVEYAQETKAGVGEFTLATNEKVSVYCTDSSNSSNTGFYSFKTKSSGTTVTLQGTIPTTASVGSVALYPYSSSHSYSNYHYYYSVDRKKNMIGKSYVPAEIPMYGTKNSSGKFVFTPMTGAAKKVISGIPASVTKVKVVFTAKNVKLSGSFKVYDSSNGSTWNADYASTDNEKQYIRYFDVVDGTVTFYIPYVQGSIYGPSNLTVYDYSSDATGEAIYTDANVGNIAVSRGQVNTLPAAFLSAYGIDWSGVSVWNDPSADYPAFKTMKVTADAQYLYVLLEADPAAMGSSSHAYDNVLNLYLSNGSEANSSNWIWNKKATNVSSMGGWLRKNGAPYFTSWGGSDVSSSVSSCNGSYFYEIRYKRSLSSLLSASSVFVGAYMNNNYQRTDGTYASSYTHVGILPAPGGSMYWVALPDGSGSGSGSGSSQPSATELVYENFSESSSDIANPERGLYKMVEYKYHKRDDNENATSSYTSATSSLTDSYDDNNTLVLTLFYLFDFVDSSHISSSGLSYIRSVFDNVRAKGKKAIVRFAYNNVHPSSKHQEPTLSNIKKHLQDLTPVFQEYEDIIYVVQAGFMGTYGEWYYTSYFGPSSGGVDYTISGNSVSGFSNRKAVIDALLAAVPSSRQIELRTPEYKQCYLNPSNLSSWTSLSGFGTDAVHRLAFHNDAFLYGNGGQGGYKGDMGTFHYDWQKDMWKQQGAYLINGGEAPYSSKPISGMDGYTYSNVRAAIYDYHYSYLHHDTGYHENGGGSTLMYWWHQKGWMTDIKKMLGYRLWLENLKITGTDFNSGSSITVRLKIHNSGAAPVINQRPMKLVLLHNGTPYELCSVGDVRTVASETTKTFTVSVTLPRTVVSGDKLALWLPDQASNLRSRPEYSIRLANSGMSWSNGYNIIHTF